MPSNTINFTPEFIKACETLWRDGFDKGVNGGDEHPDFKKFFMDTCPKVKEEPSYAELQALPFNPSKCEARVEKFGYSIQCTRSPFNGGCLCKTHQNMFDKLPKGEGKDIRYGRFNQPRPDKTLDKGEPIKWGPKKPRSKGASVKTQPKLKVGEMRDYLSSKLPNTVFKDLKKKELTVLYLKELEKDSSDEESVNSPQNSVSETEQKNIQSEENTEQLRGGYSVENTEQHPEKPEEQSDEQPDEQSDEQRDEQEEQQPDEKHDEQPDEQEKEHSEEKVEDDAIGTGLSLEPVTKLKPSTLTEYKALFKELSIDTSGLKGKRAYKEAYENYLKEKEEEKTQPLSDDEDEDDDDLQEDTNSYEETTFEGVTYLEDEDTGKIYNMKHQYVGKWNEDVDNIIWVSDDFENQHEKNRQ